ncbi:hypothetical protein LCX93_01390 [Sulfurimonas sp. SWIR-19]|uniref:hypothetical protein n=1 Tax=Sulfurimonas sp. SWIR-19 TaxID=2878390 RepID=UPI001CF4E5FC|nr:hypothetical protein [Sulfurimonas sp. SWIR-19]UCN00597.1 hypothetical protein LCX93_01390 [Sulfurimonas sp. SWIR-19]
MRFFLISIFLGLFSLYASSAYEDTYLLKYSSKDSNCTLTKNGEQIPVFDPRFKDKKPPYNAYTCNAIIKEQYNDCKIVQKENTTAVVFSFGTYEFTNLLFAFKTPVKSIDGMMQVECTKKLHHK